MVLVLYFVHYDTLLQNGTVVLQNAAVTTKCNDFIRKCDIYYKLRRLLKNTSVHTEIFYLGKKEQNFSYTNELKI